MSETHTFKIGDTVEIGPGLCRGRLAADEFAGSRGTVEFTAYRGGGTPASDAFVGLRGIGAPIEIVWVFHTRLRPVQADGSTLPSYDDQTYSEAP